MPDTSPRGDGVPDEELSVSHRRIENCRCPRHSGQYGSLVPATLHKIAAGAARLRFWNRSWVLLECHDGQVQDPLQHAT